MDIEVIFKAIATLGYPIVVSIICMFYIKKQNEDTRVEREKIYTLLSEKIDSIDNNVVKLTTLHLIPQKGRREIEDNVYGD